MPLNFFPEQSLLSRIIYHWHANLKPYGKTKVSCDKPHGYITKLNYQIYLNSSHLCMQNTYISAMKLQTILALILLIATDNGYADVVGSGKYHSS